MAIYKKMIALQSSRMSLISILPRLYKSDLTQRSQMRGITWVHLIRFKWMTIAINSEFYLQRAIMHNKNYAKFLYVSFFCNLPPSTLNEVDSHISLLRTSNVEHTFLWPLNFYLNLRTFELCTFNKLVGFRWILSNVTNVLLLHNIDRYTTCQAGGGVWLPPTLRRLPLEPEKAEGADVLRCWRGRPRKVSPRAGGKRIFFSNRF